MSKKDLDASNIGMHNILSVGTLVSGNITSDEDIRIDGVLEGTLTCSKKVIIGPKGKINGELVCAILDLMGTVEGSIQCSGGSTFRSTAVVSGKIQTETIAIEAGAIIELEKLSASVKTKEIY